VTTVAPFPIVILGLGRSGSKLLRDILNYSRDVYIAPELGFHFVFKSGLLKQMRKLGDFRQDSNVEKLVDAVYSEGGSKAHLFVRSIPRDELRLSLLNGDRTERSVFESFVRSKANADKPGATVIGAKFPFHFSFTPQIREWYPQGKIVFLVRDPRAIAASELRKKIDRPSPTSEFPHFRSKAVLRAAIVSYVVSSALWYSIVIKRHKDLSNVYLLRYEDLVLEPESTIRKLCEFLGIRHEDRMENVKLKDSSFDTWEAKGFRVESVRRWEQELSVMQKQILTSVLGAYLNAFGYR